MIKKLARSIREYKREAILAPVFVALESVMDVVIPFLMSLLIDEGLNKGSVKTTVLYGIAMMICAAIALFFGAQSGKFAARGAAGFGKNLRKDIFYNVQRFSFGNIDKFSTASLITRMTTDVTNVQMAYMMIIRIACRAPLMLIFSIIMSCSINVTLSMIFLFAIPIMALGLFLIMKFAHPIFIKVFKVYDRLNVVVQENLRGVRVVKSFVREDHEIEKFDETSSVIYRLFSKAEKLMAFAAPTMQLCIYGCMIALSWVGAQFIVAGNMTTGELTSMMTYIMQILMNLMMLSVVFVMITISKASAERICEALDEESPITNGEDPVYAVADGSIDFDHVDFSYSDKTDRLALKDIDLHIRSGETIGVIGGVGSGRSSLAQLIPRLYDATAGEIKVAGVNVKDYDLVTLRDAVAVVLQKNVLFSGTIAENMRWGNPDATMDEIRHACELACANEFIDQMPHGYDTYIEAGGTNVSGGQRQRLCIARALMKKPKILILDDSTSAVDTATDAKIRDAFKTIIPGTTKIIIAQRLASVEEADRIIVMDNGQIAQIGSHEELMQTSQIYQEVYESQKKGGQIEG